MTRRQNLALLLGSVTASAQKAPLDPAAPPRTSSDPAAPPRTSSDVAWDTLSKGVEHADIDHRKKALAALGTIGPSSRAVKIAEQGLRDKDTFVRQSAATALGDMGSPEAIPALKAALDDGPEVSFTAAKALWKLGDSSSAHEILWQVLAGERKDTPGFMKTALREAKHKLRPEELALMGAREAAGIFGPAAIGVDAATEAAKAAKDGKSSPGRVVAAETLAKDPDPYTLTLLEWALDDSSGTVRAAVAKALGERGNRETIAKLVPRLNDEHHAVQYMAAASIIKLELKSGEPA